MDVPSYQGGPTDPLGYRQLVEAPDESDKPDQPAAKAPKVYARRWYVLALFCVLSCIQGFMWNSWGPISDSATLVFGWRNADIGLFATISNVGYCLAMFPASYIMDVHGLRAASLSTAGLLAVSGVIRCVTSDRIVLFWMAVVAAFLNGVAGTVSFGGPALFSSVWFPASQRSTSNALVNTANVLGMTTSFVMGPAFVTYVNPYKNTTSHGSKEGFSQMHSDLRHFKGDWNDAYRSQNHSTNRTVEIIDAQRHQIMTYLYVQAAIAGLLLVLVAVYFPAKPPSPPSVSASTARLDFRKGLTSLTMNWSFWLFAIAFSVPSGVFGVWGTVLNVNLQPLGVTQDQAAQMGLYYSLAGGLTGILISRVSDRFTGHMKQMLVALYVMGSVALLCAAIIIARFIPFNLPLLFVAAILASIAINSGVPLFYELSCEMFYPVAEGIIGGYITLLSNLVGVAFLSLLYIPNIGTQWMNWTMFSCTIGSVPLLLLVRGRYGRLTLDIASDDENHPEIQSGERLDDP